MIDRRWTRIEGWLDENEGDALQRLAAGGKVLELGAYKGRSTVCLALTARLVVSVDWHLGDPRVGNQYTLPSFMANLDGTGTRSKVVPIVARIEDACPSLMPWSFDLVFIDDDHERSIEMSTLWAKHLVVSGGVIAWHDADMPAVREWVTRLSLSGRRPVEQVGSLAWIRVTDL